MRVVLDPRHPRGVAEALRNLGRDIELLEPDDAGLIDALSSAEVLVTARWADDWLESGVRWIQSVSAGFDQFPIDQLRRRGIVLTSARGVHAVQVAEHAFALLLACTRGIGVSMRQAEHTEWRRRGVDEIAGSTMAILGLGAIGEEIARRAAAWGIDVIGTKAHPASYGGVASRVLGPDATVEICDAADIVVSVLPDDERTRHTMDSAAFEALGAGWFVNVGRGGTVDTAALIAALDHGALRGAGLDVFEVEPLPVDHPLWRHPNVVITPHMAGFSPHYGPRLARIFEANVAAFAGNAEWINRVV